MAKKSKADTAAKGLSRMEVFALDGYIHHRDEDDAMEITYQLACSGKIDEFTPARQIRMDALKWFKRSVVEKYVEARVEELEEAQSNAAVLSDDETEEDVEAKDYLTIIKELERDRMEARKNGDMDNYQKFSKLLLDYMKSSKEDVGDEDNRVLTYVPLVCVDNCPLYAEKKKEIQLQTNPKYNEFFD